MVDEWWLWLKMVKQRRAGNYDFFTFSSFFTFFYIFRPPYGRKVYTWVGFFSQVLKYMSMRFRLQNSRTRYKQNGRFSIKYKWTKIKWFSNDFRYKRTWFLWFSGEFCFRNFVSSRPRWMKKPWNFDSEKSWFQFEKSSS